MQTLYDVVESLKTVEGVTLVYCNEPDFDVTSQVGDVPSIAFNLERGDKTVTLVIPNSYWPHNPFTKEAADHVTDWFNFMDTKGIEKQMFFYRESESRFVRLKGTLKIEDEDLPENAKKLADLYASVDHVISVKVRKIIDYQFLSEIACQEALQFYCLIDIKTAQSEPHINMYCPKNIWDQDEEHEPQKERLAEQVKIREENSKKIFG